MFEDFFFKGRDKDKGVVFCLFGLIGVDEGKDGVGGVTDAVVLIESRLGQGCRCFENRQGLVCSAGTKQDGGQIVDVVQVVVVDFFDGQKATGSCLVKVLDRSVVEQVLAVKIGNDSPRIQLAFFDQLFEVFKHAAEHIVSAFVMRNKDHADPCQEAVITIEVFIVKQRPEPGKGIAEIDLLFLTVI